MTDKCPPITPIDIKKAEASSAATRNRRLIHFGDIDSDEQIYQIEDAIKHLDISKTIRTHVNHEQADFMVARARQILIELLGIHLEDCP